MIGYERYKRIDKNPQISIICWPNTNAKKAEDVLKFNRKVARAQIRAYSEHCMLRKHAKYMKLSDSDIVGDIVHILSECKELEGLRATIFKTSLDNGNFHSLGTHHIIG